MITLEDLKDKIRHCYEYTAASRTVVPEIATISYEIKNVPFEVLREYAIEMDDTITIKGHEAELWLSPKHDTRSSIRIYSTNSEIIKL